MFRIILFILVCLLAIFSYGGFNTEIKLLGFVLAALLISTFKVRGISIPRAFIVFGVLFGFVAYSYSELIRSKRIVFVELQNDKDFAKSSRLMGYLPRSQAWFHKLKSFDELAELHSKNPQASVMIWGDENYLGISLGSLKKSNVGKYQIVERVPFIGLNNLDGSHRFINALSKGIADNSSEDLKKAFAVRYNWTSQAHRAYPLFLLGNERIRAGQFDQETAILFEKAIGYIRPFENPNLRGAIMNNLGVVYIKLGRKKDEVIRAFHHAKRSLKETSPFGEKLKTGRIAKKNLKKFKKEKRGNRKNKL